MISNIITMTRGDTYVFDVTIFDEWDTSARYEIQEGDIIYFGIMFPHQKFEDAIVKKRFTYKEGEIPGRIQIRIAPEDTVDLEPGVYYYAVKLKIVSLNAENDFQTDVVTVINKTKFIIND